MASTSSGVSSCCQDFFDILQMMCHLHNCR
uniref:Uncharacterized protein n=1 Tax=Anguilla anguilla TaxID=7936 RepID=A0A0E9PMX2_ANGAN